MYDKFDRISSTNDRFFALLETVAIFICHLASWEWYPQHPFPAMFHEEEIEMDYKNELNSVVVEASLFCWTAACVGRFT